MSTQFKLPELGENIEKGDLLKVLVSVGDIISQEQPVIELETDKATLEVPSSVSGKVESIDVKPGEQVKVGQVILTVSDGAQAEAAKPAAGGAAAPRQAEAPVNGSEAKHTEPEKRSEPAAPAPASTAVQPEPSRASDKSSGISEVRLPELGENIEKGDLLKVLVSVGDTITKEQPVIELETDKATLEVPSSVAGRVKEIHVKAGEKVKVGQLILTLEGAPQSAAPSPTPGAEPKQRPAQQEEAGEPAPPKAASPAPSLVGAQPAASVPVTEEARPRPAGAVDTSAKKLVPAGPAVRRMARELGVDIAEVPGTGPAGRISPADLKEYVRSLNTRRSAPGGTTRETPPLPDFSRWGAVERETMRAVRRSTAARMAQAWMTIPHVTQHDKADITQLEQFRKQYSKRAESRGAKTTVTAFALRVVASALKMFPKFAASIDPAREEIVYKKFYHIGVAVDTDRGLLVPVIRDVDRKNILELSIELATAAQKARERKLTPEDMEGGVFTITNLGGIGGTAFTPIVNWPEVAILGMSRSSLEPVYSDGQFQPRLMLPLSLSYDHRLIDGADAARFLRWVSEALEQLFLLPFEG